MHDEIYTKNNGNHGKKVRKIKIFHTCNYFFAFSEFASPSVHTIVLPKYRFDLQIACWSFTEITFLDSHQTELFSRTFFKMMKISDMLCLRFSKLRLLSNRVRFQRKSVSASVSMERGRGFFCSLLSIFTNSLSAVSNQNKEIWKSGSIKKKSIYEKTWAELQALVLS